MKKRYRYRIYPTVEQTKFLAHVYGGCRFIYNEILARNNKHFDDFKRGVTPSKPDLTIGTMVNMVPMIRREFEWLSMTPAVALQQAVIDLRTGYKRFFENTAKYPTFKNKHYNQSFRMVGQAFGIRSDRLFISLCPGLIRVRWSRPLPSQPTSATLIKENDGTYHVSFVCGAQPILTNGQGWLGIDLGIKELFTTSDGHKEVNPRLLNQRIKRLKKQQRGLTRKTKDSNNSRKARLKLARLHSAIRHQRLDRNHKLSRALVNENQVIAIESLNILNMVKNHKLSRHIMDASWGSLIRLLKVKAEESQWCKVIHVHPFFPSSHICSGCDTKHPDRLSLATRNWTCTNCGLQHDRDINAAVNLIKVVERFGACLKNGTLLTMSWSELVTTGYYR